MVWDTIFFWVLGIVYNEINLGDAKASGLLSLELRWTWLAQEGPVIGVNPVLPSTIWSKPKVNIPAEGVVIGTPVTSSILVSVLMGNVLGRGFCLRAWQDDEEGSAFTMMGFLFCWMVDSLLCLQVGRCAWRRNSSCSFCCWRVWISCSNEDFCSSRSSVS